MDIPLPEVDLLIRSASSLVSIVDKQADQPLVLDRDSQTLRSLDRIAQLLVTKAKEEVATVWGAFRDRKQSGCAFICSIGSRNDAESPLRYVYISLNLKIPLI